MLSLPIPTPQRVRANPRYAGRGITIAFLDSGFYPHPDLTRPRNRILAHIDATPTVAIERKRFCTPHVTSWHGLMTSCVGAGNGYASANTPARIAPENTRVVFQGVAHQANLVLVKVGTPRSRRIGDAAIARALRWTIDQQERYGIRIVNISLGGDHASDGKPTDLDNLVELAVKRGMVVVAAIGNDAEPKVYAPASAAGALAVGGLDDQNSIDRARWRLYRSNYGQGVGHALKPDLIAPAEYLAAPMLPRTKTHNEALFLWRLLRAGETELARIIDSDVGQARISRATARLPHEEIRRLTRARLREEKFIHPHYQHVDGTSMAAPIVTGVIAQMLEANPGLSPADIRDILLSTAEPLDDASEERQGAGVVRADRAVTAALRRRRDDVW